ncbi:hypothetical protein [Streptomyces azureus]|uniref:Putative two-component sensor histidine kinase protein n=1 Tax=Streptomyces azureus TaxID=146537 RepID=A0A0K8PG94_STRAJ|nr:hypothetical protein [Streptomyces azureus]GAP46905.1 putative two-component sensor histidine kinase protein [Streptomyces azureus]
MSTAVETGAHERTDHAGTAPLPPAAAVALHGYERAMTDRNLSLADRLAHEAATHISWSSRERYLRNVGANGLIPTAGGEMLADRMGHFAHIEVIVDFVSEVSPDGDVLLVVTSLDGTGRALAMVDAVDRADALEWMYHIASLHGRVTTLLGQPGLDMRRAAIEKVSR